MLLDDIEAAIVTAGLGQNSADATDWFIFKGYMQEAPDRAICLYVAGGLEPLAGQPVDYPTVQIRVRGGVDDYDATQQKEDAIFKLLHDCNASVMIGSVYVYLIAMQSTPIPMGQDTNRRPALIRNYRIMKVRS